VSCRVIAPKAGVILRECSDRVAAFIAPRGRVILSGVSRQSCCVIAPVGMCHSERSVPTELLRYRSRGRVILSEASRQVFLRKSCFLISGRDAQSKNLSWISQDNACRLARACASTSFKALRKRHHVPLSQILVVSNPYCDRIGGPRSPGLHLLLF
jgi:hypothetical protein